MKQLFNISKEGVANNAQSVLILELGRHYCCAMIMKLEGFQPERLICYETGESPNPVSELIAIHPEFQGHFSDVLINYAYPESVTVPSAYYNYQDGRKMLQLIHGDELGEAVLSEHLPDWHLYNVYEVPKTIHGWISMRFHSGKYWHSYTAALNNFSKSDTCDIIQADFKSGQFGVIVIKSGKLQLTQTFDYTEPADVLYYLLKICRELLISPEQVSLVLSGFLEKQSSLYRELYQYFSKISFQQVPGSIDLQEPFTEYPGYFFSSLFNLAACAL